VWLLVLLGIVLLGTIGFLGAQVIGGLRPGTSPSTAPGFALDDYRGQTFTAANLALTGKSLHPVRVDEASADVERGRVIATEPGAGQTVHAGDDVKVHVSTGPPQTAVPPVIGQTYDLATRTLERAHLIVGNTTYEYSATAPSATVIRTDPTAGTPVDENSPVSIVLSQGPEPTPTPSPTPSPSPTPTPVPPTPTPEPTPTT
jgi:serine/threonine-protein kinase